MAKVANILQFPVPMPFDLICFVKTDINNQTVRFMPGPPDNSSVAFANDVKKKTHF
jgi:hypothetical protein